MAYSTLYKVVGLFEEVMGGGGTFINIVGLLHA